MEEIDIRRAQVNETERLQQISKQTFYETFARSNSESDMQKYLKESFNDEKLTAELANPDSYFYFATKGEEIIGYLKLNSGIAQTELKDQHALEIERIYVLSAYHGKKVGQLLYEQAIELARSMGKSSIWLGVWEENPRAISFYSRNGFVAFDKHIFKMGEDEQTDIMMKKELAD